MLLVDDILFSPIKGINWIFKKVHELAQEELVGEADRLRESLTELYMQLEAGQITEEEFEQQETLLLDRLDALDEDDNMIGDEEEEDEEDEEDDEEDEEEDEEEEDEEEEEEDDEGDESE